MQLWLIPMLEKTSFAPPYYGVLKNLHNKVSPYLVKVTDSKEKAVGTFIGNNRILVYARAVPDGECDLEFADGTTGSGFVTSYNHHLALAVLACNYSPKLPTIKVDKFEPLDPLFEFSERFGDKEYCITKYEPQRADTIPKGVASFEYHDEIMSPLFDGDENLIAFTSWQSRDITFAISLQDLLEVLV